MAFPRELVKQRRDAIPGRVRGVARVLRCQSIKFLYGGRSVDDVCAGVLERGGRRRGGVEPSSEADLTRGSVEASNEVDSACGGIHCASLAGCGGHQGRDRVACAF
jgi:hypothetical protein